MSYRTLKSKLFGTIGGLAVAQRIPRRRPAAARHQRPANLIRPSPQIRRLLTITKLDEILAIA